jgi:hypothetical protein
MLAEAILDHLKPISEVQAQIILLQVVRIIGCRKPEPDVAAGYVMVMVQYPPDLLRKSMVRCLSTETWHKLPTPGALCKMANDDLERRRDKLAVVQIAMRRLEMVARLRERRPSSSSPASAPSGSSSGRG